MAYVYTVFISCGFILFGNMDFASGQNDAFTTMKRLHEDLLHKGGYSKLVSPIGPGGKALSVTFNLDVKRLVDLDIDTQVLSLDAVISMMWYDNQLKWNPDRYGNINMIRLPSEIVWQPDIILYNSADQFKGLPSGDINMVITFDGYVVFSPLIKTNSFCNIPNSQPKHGDVVTCSLKFGSWAYDGLALNIMPAGLTDDDVNGTEYYVDMTSLEKDFNRQWEPISVTVARNKLVYACCPEPYIDIVYKISLKYKGGK